MALLDLAGDLYLAHPLTVWTLLEEGGSGKPAKALQPHHRLR